jgi:hypothetical protein
MRIALTRVLLAALALFAGSACATVFISEGWETGTPPAVWPYKQAPSACDAPWQGNIWNGWYPGIADYCTAFDEWALTGRSTTQKHSGTYSFWIYRDPGVSESPDIVKDLESPYPTKVYIRMWMYFDANFVNFNTPVSREPSYHLFFTNSAQSLTGLRINMLARVPWTSPPTCGAGYGGVPSNQPYMFFSVQDYSNEWNNGTYPAGCYNILQHLQEWTCYEFMMDANTNTVTIWAGNTEIYTATNAITQTNFTRIQISNYMSNEEGTPFATSYYVDDIEIADQRINCGGSLLPGPTNPRWRPAEWDVPTWVERLMYASLR